jgi:hypothetical protein
MSQKLGYEDFADRIRETLRDLQQQYGDNVAAIEEIELELAQAQDPKVDVRATRRSDWALG